MTRLVQMGEEIEVKGIITIYGSLDLINQRESLHNTQIVYEEVENSCLNQEFLAGHASTVLLMVKK